MSESFSVIRRFFDDKNYPRGFARHGDYTIRESQALENHGLAFLELENGSREPVTEEEKQFVAFCRGERPAETFFEKTWAKYRARISRTKRVYTLTGELSNDAVDDYNAD
ncbi:hypothetical protein JP35_07635 [Gallibacterium anatis]|uniref:DUF413 domain-containing protein n=1 Tax=Gallibacterium anatis TaxID=750 RepID=UPI000531E144|nr:DUF413 domain-containing protein [Gallibacterium anatis]KGQ38694.1 hypothetical protein JP35_07635 [Gallibacterium anatis]